MSARSPPSRAVDEDEDSQAGTDSGGNESDDGEVFSDDEDAHARLIVTNLGIYRT
jgi:hypothetical protein